MYELTRARRHAPTHPSRPPSHARPHALHHDGARPTPIHPACPGLRQTCKPCTVGHSGHRHLAPPTGLGTSAPCLKGGGSRRHAVNRFVLSRLLSMPNETMPATPALNTGVSTQPIVPMLPMLLQRLVMHLRLTLCRCWRSYLHVTHPLLFLPYTTKSACAHLPCDLARGQGRQHIVALHTPGITAMDGSGDNSDGCDDDPLARRMACGHDLEAASQWEGSDGEQEEGGSDDMGDDECMVCGEGGSLVMCDGCTNAAHVACVGLDHVPAGDWFCSHCEAGR
jgi:hypothetical protein